jgi:crossover junction endodeoxyribonuclease RuvC
VTPRILAADLSLTSTGIAVNGETRTIRTNLRGAERLDYIASRVVGMAVAHAVELVALEGYSFGSKGRAVFSIGELGGCVRLELHRAGIPFVDVSPSSLKKYATGKGNCGKDDMIETAIRRFAFAGHGNDEADAWLLLKMAEAAYSDAPRAAYQAQALAGVEWPELDEGRRSA